MNYKIDFTPVIDGLPSLLAIAQGHPLSWTTVLVQLIASVAGARAYLSGTTSHDRVELTGPPRI